MWMSVVPIIEGISKFYLKRLLQLKTEYTMVRWSVLRLNCSGDNVSNVRCEASRTFRSKEKGNTWKAKVMNLKKTVRTKILNTCIETNQFKVGYQHRINL
jgi:hypothetical protein